MTLLAREKLAYVMVCMGALLAVALIRWFPIVPSPRGSLRTVLDASPVVAPPASAPPSTSTPLIPRRIASAPVIERRAASEVAPVESAVVLPPAPVLPAAPISRPLLPALPSRASAPRRAAGAARAEPGKDTPFVLPPKPETFAERPAREVDLPPPILPGGAPRPQGIRARLGDIEKFTGRLREIAAFHEAGLTVRSGGFRLSVPAARRDELKKSVNAAILEFLSEDGTEIHVEIEPR